MEGLLENTGGDSEGFGSVGDESDKQQVQLERGEMNQRRGGAAEMVAGENWCQQQAGGH